MQIHSFCCILTELFSPSPLFQLWWDPDHPDHWPAKVTLMLVGNPQYSPRHLLLHRSHLPTGHGYEQWPWLREARPWLCRAGRQSHGHHGCHDDERFRRFDCQRREKRWGPTGGGPTGGGPTGGGSGQEDSSVAASPDWKEAVAAGEGHLPVIRPWRRLHTRLPSCGSQAHGGIQTCVYIWLSGEEVIFIKDDHD